MSISGAIAQEPIFMPEVARIKLTPSLLRASIQAARQGMPHYETIDHRADLQLRFRGATRELLFEHAARGLFEYTIGGLDLQDAAAERPIALAAIDDRELLVDWLNELLFLLDARGELHAWPHLDRVDGGQLTGRTGFVTVDRGARRLRNPVKAATYHDLKLEQIANGWLAEVLFDL